MPPFYTHTNTYTQYIYFYIEHWNWKKASNAGFVGYWEQECTQQAHIWSKYTHIQLKIIEFNPKSEVGEGAIA